MNDLGREAPNDHRDEALELAYGLHPELLGWSREDFDRAEQDAGVNCICTSP